jgi:hypothetical protein
MERRRPGSVDTLTAARQRLARLLAAPHPACCLFRGGLSEFCRSAGVRRRFFLPTP